MVPGSVVARDVSDAKSGARVGSWNTSAPPVVSRASVSSATLAPSLRGERIDYATTYTGLFSRAELEAVLTAAGVGLWAWEIESGRLRWSSETAALHGRPTSQLELTLADFVACVDEYARADVAAKIQAAVKARSQDYVIEYPVRLPDGTTRWAESRGRVVLGANGEPTGMVGAVHDVTRRTQDAEQLKRSEEQYRLFTELATDYVYVVDMQQPSLAPSMVAGAFERVTGYTPHEIGQLGGWTQVMHPDDRQSVEELTEALRSGRPFVNEYRIITKGGEVRWLRDRALPITDPTTGALLKLVGGVRDITDNRALQDQLNHAFKLEALARLAGSVAHDFNNLLTVMYSAASMLEPPKGDAPNASAASELNEAISRAAELTASLLAFARKRPSVPRVSLLSEALRKVAPMLQRAAGERVSVVVEDQVADARVAVDTSQLDVALLNLVINARDAMPGGGTLRVVGSVVDFSSSERHRPPELRPAPYAAIDVIDTGTGIAPEIRNRLFEPFFTTKEPGHGTGLGLSTVHGIAHQCGGAVGLTTALGRGSTFTLYLPIADAPLGVLEPRIEARHSIGGTETVLVVEDEPMVLRMVVRMLEDLGYRVLSFACAEDALALDASTLATLDLLLTDIRLPGMPGTELALALTEEHPGLPVVLMSGLIDGATQQQVLASGRYRLIEKPFMPDGLARCLREALEARASDQSRR